MLRIERPLNPKPWLSGSRVQHVGHTARAPIDRTLALSTTCKAEALSRGDSASSSGHGKLVVVLLQYSISSFPLSRFTPFTRSIVKGKRTKRNKGVGKSEWKVWCVFNE